MYSTPPCGRDKSGPYTLIERDVIDPTMPLDALCVSRYAPG